MVRVLDRTRIHDSLIINQITDSKVIDFFHIVRKKTPGEPWGSFSQDVRGERTLETTLVCTQNQNLVSLQQTNLQNMADFGEGHTCLECGKSYNKKWRLEEHKRSHTGEVGLCPVSFEQNLQILCALNSELKGQFI